MNSINVWIIEDDADYRRMLVRILARAKYIGECMAFPSCIEMFETLNDDNQPEVILMDLGLPRMSGVDGIKKLASSSPDSAIIALTVFGKKQMVMQAIQAGASGYLLKSSSSNEILKGVKEVYFGGSVFSPSVARVILENVREPSSSSYKKLAAREIEVIEKLAHGKTAKEIASDLNISPSTVSTYLERIYTKLGVQSQASAVAKAIRSGIIQ